ncbi:uncharacterized protein [Ptychodera flava]|uniref:uncharacterized protein n=1 Tax=Ptychodera flava TaxID=63121 RepID=UPI00396AAEAF
MSTKSADSLIRHRKNVARKSTTKPAGFEAKLKSQQKRPSTASSSSPLPVKRANSKDLSRKDLTESQGKDQTDSSAPAAAATPSRSAAVNGEVTPTQNQSEQKTNGRTTSNGKAKDDTSGAAPDTETCPPKTIHPTVQKLRSSRSRSPSPSTANHTNSKNTPPRNSSSDTDSDGAKSPSSTRKAVTDSPVRKSSRLSLSVHKQTKGDSENTEAKEPRENGDVNDEEPDSSDEKQKQADSDVMLENKRDENASRKEDNNSHKDNLSKISTDNTKPKRTFPCVQRN